MLACAANGDKLKAVVILKAGSRGHKLPAGYATPNNIVIWYQEKAWMTKALMQRWFNEVYLRHYDCSFFDFIQLKHLLSFDSFRGHTANDVKALAKSHAVDLAVIPGGCTSSLQPIDIGINQPFKAILRHYWCEHMREQIRARLETGTSTTIPKVNIEQVLTWISNAWHAVNPATVRHAFNRWDIDFEHPHYTADDRMLSELVAEPQIEAHHDVTSADIVDFDVVEDSAIIISNSNVEIAADMPQSDSESDSNDGDSDDEESNEHMNEDATDICFEL